MVHHLGLRLGFILIFSFVAVFSPTAAFADSVLLSVPNLKEGGEFGSDVAALDDVNASGTLDVIVGAHQEDVGGVEFAGKAFVFDGGTGELLYELVSPNPGISGGAFGYSVTGTTDLTGDGIGDFAVGAHLDEIVPGGSSGRVYLFSGATGELVYTLAPLGPEDINFGFEVAALLDITGDDIGELAVGRDATTFGKVEVFNGATGTPLFTISSPNPVDRGMFGSAIAGLGDVSGDSVPDILVGANFEDRGAAVFAGRAYVFSGADGSLLYEVLSPTPASSGIFGIDVDVMPDANGDGITDMVISASAELIDAGHGGKVYIFSGADGQLLHTLASPNQDENTAWGPAVAGIADIDGDGFGDAIVGAWAEGGEGFFGSGRVHVFSGATGSPILALTSPNAIMNGAFGWAVAGTGDMNNDGLPDLIVGAIGEDRTDISSFGRAYVITTDMDGGEGEGEGEGPLPPPGCAAGPGSSTATSWWIIIAASLLLASAGRWRAGKYN